MAGGKAGLGTRSIVQPAVMRVPVPHHIVLSALALALGAAVSLGLARFSYALLLPPMREDLQWSYFTSGLMNAVNAAGYFVGAFTAPAGLRRWPAHRLLVGAAAAAALILLAHALTRSDLFLALWRGATGVVSAWMFVAGGVLAADLSTQLPAHRRASAGLVLGLYYGGVGWGIVACALVLPPLLHEAAAWPLGWMALAACAAVALGLMAWKVSAPSPAAPKQDQAPRVPWQAFGWALAAYFMFGLGYIGYMTFIVTLLRERDLTAPVVAAFYALLGVGVMASPWLWAGLLQRHRDGKALAALSALLAVATAMPVVLPHPLWAFVSGALFGACFLSVVASTTAWVRHNLPAAQWASGISAFTAVFAAGQVIGPGWVGWLADGPAGLSGGLSLSAAFLLLGAILAWQQRSLSSTV